MVQADQRYCTNDTVSCEFTFQYLLSCVWLHQLLIETHLMKQFIIWLHKSNAFLMIYNLDSTRHSILKEVIEYPPFKSKNVYIWRVELQWKKEQERESSIHQFTSQMATMAKALPRLKPGTKNLRLLHGGQDWVFRIILYFPRYISKALDWKMSSWDSNKHPFECQRHR